MMTSQILKSVDFTKTQKSRYLKNEALFFLLIKNSLITHQGLFYCKNSFVVEVTFKEINQVPGISQSQNSILFWSVNMSQSRNFAIIFWTYVLHSLEYNGVSGLEKLGFLVHESPCSSKQVQENVVRLKILFTLWLFEVHVFTSLCTSSCTKWSILWKDESVQ